MKNVMYYKFVWLSIFILVQCCQNDASSSKEEVPKEKFVTIGLKKREQLIYALELATKLSVKKTPKKNVAIVSKPKQAKRINKPIKKKQPVHFSRVYQASRVSNQGSTNRDRSQSRPRSYVSGSSYEQRSQKLGFGRSNSNASGNYSNNNLTQRNRRVINNVQPQEAQVDRSYNNQPFDFARKEDQQIFNNDKETRREQLLISEAASEIRESRVVGKELKKIQQDVANSETLLTDLAPVVQSKEIIEETRTLEEVLEEEEKNIKNGQLDIKTSDIREKLGEERQMRRDQARLMREQKNSQAKFSNQLNQAKQNKPDMSSGIEQDFSDEPLKNSFFTKVKNWWQSIIS